MDECAADNGGCGQLCANTPGSRTCRSDSQWTIGPVPWPMFPNGCLFSCRPGYRCVDPECLVCEDEDECGPGGRGSGCGQLCVNTPGSYHCACLPGELCLVSTCPSVLQIICLSSPPCKLYLAQATSWRQTTTRAGTSTSARGRTAAAATRAPTPVGGITGILGQNISDLSALLK